MADPWTDVAAHPLGGFVRAIAEAGAVRVEWDGVLLWRTRVTTDFLRYLRVVVSPLGATAAIGQSGEGAAIVVTATAAENIGPTFGMFPVALRFTGETLHTYRCGPGDFVPLYLDGVEILRTHAVEGIREVLPDGTIILGQPTAAGVFDGHNFGQYTRKDGWIVGQSGFSIACLHEASHRFFTARRGNMAEGVHFAVQGTMLAVVALTEVGPFFKTFTPPYPVDAVDPPIKPPEGPVFTPLRLPDAAQAIVEALYQRHKDLALGDDDQRRTLTGKIAEQVRFTLGAEWGWKKAGGPPSKDSIARRTGGFIHGFDLFNGSTRAPNDHPMSVDITAQTFIEVQPVNHLGAVDPPDDGDPPPAPVDLGPILQRLTAAEARIAHLEAKPSMNVAIKSSRGRYLRDDWGDNVGKFDRTESGGGETYTLEPK